MKYYSEEQAGQLRTALEERILGWSDVTTRRMFGCPAYSVEGRLFAFVVNDGIVLTQLRLRDRELLAEDFETESFVAGEREIERWTKVVTTPERLSRLMRYVQRSYDAALAH